MGESEQEQFGSDSDKKNNDQQAGIGPSTDVAVTFFQVTDNVVFQPMLPAPEVEALPVSASISQFISQTYSDFPPSFNDASLYFAQVGLRAIPFPVAQGSDMPGEKPRHNTSLARFFLAIWRDLLRMLIFRRGYGGIGNMYLGSRGG